jgi:hypothetical protein
MVNYFLAKSIDTIFYGEAEGIPDRDIFNGKNVNAVCLDK